jgi:hypothetical protein
LGALDEFSRTSMLVIFLAQNQQEPENAQEAENVNLHF